MVDYNTIGGASFALWGLIHVAVGAVALVIFYGKGSDSMLDFVDIDASLNEESSRMADLVAEFYQALLLIGLTVTVIGVTLNFDGEALGLALNAVLVASIEVYFVWYEVRPGHRPVSIAILTVLLLVAGVGFCGLGL